MKESENNFLLKLILVCIAFFITEFIYIFFTILSMDDFWLAYHNYEYLKGIPYRDFAPYKTVLGYYILLPPLILFHGLLRPLLFTKVWIALLNSFFLAVIAIWLKKFYAPKAVLFSLTLLVLMQIFLCFSSEIRIDILAYWFCLISILFIFEERYIFSGLSLGFAFLISQKAAWYFVATNVGFLSYWLFEDRRWNTIKAMLIFNGATSIILTVYILFWAFFSDLFTVLKSVFYEPYLISSLRWYLQFKSAYWCIIVKDSPGMVLIGPIALIGLFFLPVKKYSFIISYALVILYFILNLRQPFAYYFLALIPVIFIVYSAFFSVIDRELILSSRQKKIIIFFCILYILGLLILSWQFNMPNIYLIVVLIPFSLLICLTDFLEKKQYGFYKNLIIFSFIFIGIIVPIARFIGFLPTMDGHYQRAMLHLMKELLNEGGSYIAGVPLDHEIKQPVPGLVHLTGPSISYLEKPTEELCSIMHLSSLYLSPENAEDLIESIKKSSIKLYVDNNRLHYLPLKLRQFLASQYAHFWGSIYLYAPTVNKGQQKIEIKFAGRYRVEAPKEASIDLGNKKIASHLIVSLNSGTYWSESNSDYRLIYLPGPLKQKLNPKFRMNNWQNVLSWF